MFFFVQFSSFLRYFLASQEFRLAYDQMALISRFLYTALLSVPLILGTDIVPATSTVHTIIDVKTLVDKRVIIARLTEPQFDSTPSGTYNLNQNGLSLVDLIVANAGLFPFVRESKGVLFEPMGIVDNTSPIGVRCKSSPYCVFFSNTSMMRVDYSGSPFSTFLLSKFWWGCGIAARNSVARNPTACNLTITGHFAEAGKAPETQSFEYRPGIVLPSPLPPIALSADMIEADVDESKFKGLTSVEYRIKSDTIVPDGFVGARMDNFNVYLDLT